MLLPARRWPETSAQASATEGQGGWQSSSKPTGNSYGAGLGFADLVPVNRTVNRITHQAFPTALCCCKCPNKQLRNPRWGGGGALQVGGTGVGRDLLTGLTHSSALISKEVQGGLGNETRASGKPAALSGLT